MGPVSDVPKPISATPKILAQAPLGAPTHKKYFPNFSKIIGAVSKFSSA